MDGLHARDASVRGHDQRLRRLGDALDRALAVFAELYADQNELDYAALTTAVKTGRITAQTGL